MSLFRELGEALYGEHWQRSLAHGLDISPRAVARMANGQNEVPAWVMSYMTDWLEAAQRDRDGLLERAKRALAEPGPSS